MNTLRFNPFKQIHQGLRALLYDTALSIQHTHFDNPDEAAVTMGKVSLVLQLFHGHAEVEDSRLLPLIQEHEPSLAASFESEHDEDEALAGKLEDTIRQYGLCSTAAERLQSGTELQQAFDEFTAFNLQHMNREETVLNAALWQHCSDEELMQLVQNIAAGIPPEKNQHYSLWMLRGNNNEEVARWLNAVKYSAPPQVFDNLYSLAAAGLGRERLKNVLRIMSCFEEAQV